MEDGRWKMEEKKEASYFLFLFRNKSHRSGQLSTGAKSTPQPALAVACEMSLPSIPSSLTPTSEQTSFISG
jgi:hypothetical protein